MGLARFALLERHEVGASFARWPAEMRFITPSFTSNSFGLLDLNAIATNTSPAWTTGREHPSGQEYARYLQVLAGHFDLPVRAGVDVRAVEPLPDGAGFLVRTSAGVLRSRFVIWAAGEFQYPRDYPFPGAEHCRHTSEVRTWREVAGDEVAVIGGYESGIDAAYHLCLAGKRVRVFDDAASWERASPDPSIALSPYTRERLDAALATGRLELLGDAAVVAVEETEGGYALQGDDGERWYTPHRPILATGFEGGLRLVADLFDWEAGSARLSERDESLRAPGLFVVGPQVRHEGVIFCFIYKFRQRFAVVAAAIGERLGLDLAPLEAYRDRGMYLDDLSCCGQDCDC